MPYTAHGTPYSGTTDRSRQCSHAAAVDAAEGRQAKTTRYLAWLRAVGQATDHGAAEHFGWPLSSICSIRNGLGKKITDVGTCEGRYGKPVTIWTAAKVEADPVPAVQGHDTNASTPGSLF